VNKSLHSTTPASVKVTGVIHSHEFTDWRRPFPDAGTGCYQIWHL